jgi:tRNA uridine 5-carboxymethylaminomethyl modification enzyme
MLRRPEVHYDGVVPAPVADRQVADQVEIQAKYEGYIERQRQEVARRAEYESRRLPADLDYREVRGLSAEVQQKLSRHRPETLGQAARISGVTPAAISLLLVHLKRGFRALDKKQA